MIILVYILAIWSFALGYWLTFGISGFIFLQIKQIIYKIVSPTKDVELEGLALLSAAGLSVYLNFASTFLLFNWCGYNPNMFILTPIIIYAWFNVAKFIHRHTWSGGAQHWGMLIGAVSFLISFSKIF